MTARGPFPIIDENGNTTSDTATLVGNEPDLPLAFAVNNVVLMHVPLVTVDNADGGTVQTFCTKPGVFDADGNRVLCDPVPVTLNDVRIGRTPSGGINYGLPDGRSVDARTPEQFAADMELYRQSQQYTGFDNLMEMTIVTGLAYITGAGIAGEMGAAGAAGADAGAVEASGAVDLVPATDLAAPTLEASPLTAPGVSDAAPAFSTDVPPYLDSAPSIGGVPEGAGFPQEVSGPSMDAGAAPTDLPQTISPAARTDLITQIAAKTGSVSSAISMVNRLYTAVRGGKSPDGQQPVVAYQRTGAPSGGADTGGLGANVTPMLKQLAVPAVALLAAIFSR